MWFEDLFGFREESPEYVRDNFILSSETIKSKKNGNEFTYGVLEIPMLKQLRGSVSIGSDSGISGALSLKEVVGNVQEIMTADENALSLFQVASQFNLLEMIKPTNTPTEGITSYEKDMTQGPACAIAAGAGTVYRNYFVNVDGEVGQTGNNKLFLTLVGDGAFGNETDWVIKAIRRSLDLFRNVGLDVSIISYGKPNMCVNTLINEFK